MARKITKTLIDILGCRHRNKMYGYMDLMISGFIWIGVGL